MPISKVFVITASKYGWRRESFLGVKLTKEIISKKITRGFYLLGPKFNRLF